MSLWIWRWSAISRIRNGEHSEPRKVPMSEQKFDFQNIDLKLYLALRAMSKEAHP